MSRVMILAILCFLMVGTAEVYSAIQPPVQSQGDSSKVVNLQIDKERSVVKWRGTEMRGADSHEGILKLSDGVLKLENGVLVSGYFVADMHSIEVTDIPKSDPVPRRYLTEHLESEDFFHVEKYPTARFEITRTEDSGGVSLMITGNLSIRDVIKPVSFKAYKTINDSELVYRASFTIDRFEWNVSYHGSYWERISSIIDNNFVDAEMSINVRLVVSSVE
ncbi:YceI family protein [Gracilimonas sp.]|uniref:YceI family protein n=1 Tax=Gracilimonas sp. TaxID=1974203 RepID=UPI0032EDB85C